VPALIELLASEEHAKGAERALARAGSVALGALEARLPGAEPPLRGRIVRTIGRFLPDANATLLLISALEDADPKTRRNAAIALGHARSAEVERALLRALEGERRPEMRRSLATSLGKVGSTRALPVLREAAASPEDPEMRRVAARALAMAGRTASRADRGAIDPSRIPARPVLFDALVRRGLEALLAKELAELPGVREVSVVSPGRVQAYAHGGIDELFRARTMLLVRFPLPLERLRVGEDASDAIARALAGPTAQNVFGTWTAGVVRYRIAWAEGGHKRAATWATAAKVDERVPGLVNDPTGSLWELVVDSKEQGAVELALVPRGLSDPRFPWRRRTVPAASHPTIAAALARAAGVRPADIVWDPFVGSGAELVERAALGPYASLIGSDSDPRALAAARENLNAAGVAARLERTDALDFSPPGVTLVVTNPPMGRRAARAPGLPQLLDQFVAHAAQVLVPGGRLVWMAPWPTRARAAARGAGLTLEEAYVVDMGGFEAELQRWSKPSRHRARRAT
jgi:23S rRNA G2445 N2-methylase RlmL